MSTSTTTEHVAIWVGNTENENGTPDQVPDDDPVPSSVQEDYPIQASNGGDAEGTEPPIESMSRRTEVFMGYDEDVPAFAQELEGPEAIQFLYDMGLIEGKTGILNESQKTSLRQKLYKAALDGDWASASSTFELYPSECEVEITNRGETVLHIAATEGHYDFVRNLLNMISAEALTHRDIAGNTALLCATSSGHVRVAELMLEGNNQYLAMIRGLGGRLPVHLAAAAGKIEMVRLLYKVTRNVLTEKDRISLFLELIDAGIYDLALKMIEDNPLLAEAKDENGKTGLDAFLRQLCNDQTLLHKGGLGSNTAQRKNHKYAYARELLKRIWIRQTTNMPCRSIFFAAEQGKFELLTMLNECFPNLILLRDENGRNIFHVAVHHRHAHILKFINEMGSSKMQIITSVDHKSNNLLHFAAMKPPDHRLNVVAGAAPQLQRELLWFEAVKKVVPKELASKENLEGKTPETVLMENHLELMTAVEKWMKSTANSCMLVATLIATVVFAAAFTLPGGNKQDTGIPIFVGKTSFKIFAVFDAVALMSSVSSILIFLSSSYFTYSLDDFRRSMPSMFILGLGMLLYSAVVMLVAFVAAFYIIFEHGLETYATFVAAISLFPVLSFIWVHRSLFLDVCQATCAYTSLYKADQNPTPAEAESHVGIKID